MFIDADSMMWLVMSLLVILLPTFACLYMIVRQFVKWNKVTQKEIEKWRKK